MSNELTVTLPIAMTETWQKGVTSVQLGGSTVFTTIVRALEDRKGALIGRHGTIELTIALQHMTGVTDLDRGKILERNAGIFPCSEVTIQQWSNAYLEATTNADLLALAWYKPLAGPEWSFVDVVNPKCQKIPLRALEPYYCEPRWHWTRALEGQSVCVVSSFTETIAKQIGKANEIWGSKHDTLLPESVQWSFVRSYYSPVLAQGQCGWPSGVNSWSEAVDHMEAEVLKTGAQIILIGCGGLAMPLAYRLKQKGRIAIVLGGAIQVLFGMRGKRWEGHPIIESFWNDAWVYPDESEEPKGASTVEGGCYW